MALFSILGPRFPFIKGIASAQPVLGTPNYVPPSVGQVSAADYASSTPSPEVGNAANAGSSVLPMFFALAQVEIELQQMMKSMRERRDTQHLQSTQQIAENLQKAQQLLAEAQQQHAATNQVLQQSLQLPFQPRKIEPMQMLEKMYNLENPWEVGEVPYSKRINPAYIWPTKQDYDNFKKEEEKRRVHNFGILHPDLIAKVGFRANCGTNISTVAERFSQKITTIVDTQETKYTKVYTNGIRHLLGASILSYKLGNKVAKQVLDLHEFNPNLLDELIATYGYNTKFYNPPDQLNADAVVDALNNLNGRNLGYEFSKKEGDGSYKALFIFILENAHNNGFYIWEQDGNNYKIKTYKISKETLDECIKLVYQLDNFGFSVEERERCLRGEEEKGMKTQNY